MAQIDLLKQYLIIKQKGLSISVLVAQNEGIPDWVELDRTSSFKSVVFNKRVAFGLRDSIAGLSGYEDCEIKALSFDEFHQLTKMN